MRPPAWLLRLGGRSCNSTFSRTGPHMTNLQGRGRTGSAGARTSGDRAEGTESEIGESERQKRKQRPQNWKGKSEVLEQVNELLEELTNIAGAISAQVVHPPPAPLLLRRDAYKSLETGPRIGCKDNPQLGSTIWPVKKLSLSSCIDVLLLFPGAGPYACE